MIVPNKNKQLRNLSVDMLRTTTAKRSDVISCVFDCLLLFRTQNERTKNSGVPENFVDVVVFCYYYFCCYCCCSSISRFGYLTTIIIYYQNVYSQYTEFMKCQCIYAEIVIVEFDLSVPRSFAK